MYVMRSLWEQYVDEAERQLAVAPNDRLVLAYERLLADPADEQYGLARLARFCGLEASADALANAAGAINAGRAGAFAADPELKSFYDRIKGTQWMKRYGYTDLV